MSSLKGAGLALVVAATLSGALALAFPYQPTDDARQFEVLARNLHAGRGFSLAEHPPFTATMTREPLYPLLVAGVYAVAGPRYGAVQVVQIGLLLVSVALVYWIGLEMFGPSVARAAALITALAPPLVNYPSYLLSETLFTALLVLFVWTLWRAQGRQPLWWAAAAGAVWGLSVLCKTLMAPLWMLVAAAWWLALRRQPGGASAWVGRIAVFTVGGMLLIGPWMLRNVAQFGTGNLVSLRGSKAMWERAQRIAYTPEQLRQSLVYSLSEYVGHRVFPQAAAHPREVLLRESALANARQAALLASGLSESAVDRVMMGEAAAVIRQHPFVYFGQCFVEWVKSTAVTYLPVLNEPRVETLSLTYPHGRTALSAIRGLLRLLAYPLLGFGVWGLVALRREWRRCWAVVVPILALNGLLSLVSGLGRYGVPLVPLYALVAAVGWQHVKRRRLFRMPGRPIKGRFAYHNGFEQELATALPKAEPQGV